MRDGVEVTAALEPAEDAAPAPAPVEEPGRRELLAYHGVPAATAARLGAGPLPFALSAALKFGRLSLTAGARPLLLAGPPGAGKTLTAARLATRLVMAGTAPLVITADGRRAGATEQLAAFTRLLGLTLLVASNPITLGRALARRQEGAPVLIDAPGCDLFNPSDAEELRSLCATADATMALVLPAGLDAGEAADLASVHAEAGAELLIATRLDVARRLGGVLAAAGAGLALAEAESALAPRTGWFRSRRSCSPNICSGMKSGGPPLARKVAHDPSVQPRARHRDARRLTGDHRRRRLRQGRCGQDLAGHHAGPRAGPPRRPRPAVRRRSGPGERGHPAGPSAAIRPRRGAQRCDALRAGGDVP